MSGKTRILITRPKEQAEAFREQLERKNPEYECLIAPVLEIKFRDIDTEDCSYDALIMTSINALPSIEKQTIFDFSVPVLCVGEKTAVKTREIGFYNFVHVAKNAQALYQYIKGHEGDFETILYLRGKDISFDFKEKLGKLGIGVIENIVYEAINSDDFPNNVLHDLKTSKIDVITFFSARSAKSFIDILEAHNIKLNTTKALCISQSVLESLDGYFKDRVYVSRTPDEGGMTQALANLS